MLSVGAIRFEDRFCANRKGGTGGGGWVTALADSVWRLLQLAIERQGVVTYMSPVEAFATAIKFFDRQKVCLIA